MKDDHETKRGGLDMQYFNNKKQGKTIYIQEFKIMNTMKAETKNYGDTKRKP
jgi:hypothetical protein